MKIPKIIVLISLPLALSGCFENKKNTEKLCADNPDLKCERLNTTDGQCRLPRTDLIWHKYEVLKHPSIANKIEEHKLTSVYRRCLELASQIRTIDQSDLIQIRVDALINAGEDLQRLVAELKQAKTPEALYFLWSQEGDNQARREFLQLEGKPELENAYMQYALATFYITRDREKAITLLHRSLELSTANEVNPEVMQSLASSYYSAGDKEKAYIWAQVGKQFNVSVADESKLSLLYGFDKETYSQLDSIANNVVSAIKKGQYASSIIPNSLK